MGECKPLMFSIRLSDNGYTGLHPWVQETYLLSQEEGGWWGNLKPDSQANVALDPLEPKVASRSQSEPTMLHRPHIIVRRHTIRIHPRVQIIPKAQATTDPYMHGQPERQTPEAHIGGPDQGRQFIPNQQISQIHNWRLYTTSFSSDEY